MTGPDEKQEIEAIKDLEVDERSAEEVAGGDGKVQIQDIHITKPTDTASPTL